MESRSVAYDDVVSALKDHGMPFHVCSHAYGEDDNNPYVAAARFDARDGELEVDDVAVVSKGDDDGAYVMTWLWVSDNAAGIERE